MNRLRKLLGPSMLTGALLAALVLAPGASAETRVGEATAPVNPALNPQADITAAHAEYNSDSGTVTFKVTTAEAPSPGTEAEPSELEMEAGLITASTCNRLAINSPAYPIFAFEYEYAEEEPAVWELIEHTSEAPEPPETYGLATRSADGSTTTLSATVPRAVNRPYNCAAAYVVDPAAHGEPEFLIFPIAVPSPPPPPAPPAPVPAPAPAAPAPAALSIAKLGPLTLKVGKWKTVRIKIADTGGTATAPGSLRLKAPRNVLVKPEKQKLPVLTAGGTWTLTAKVQLTAKAKKKSTVKLTATAKGATAKGSLVIKRKG